MPPKLSCVLCLQKVRIYKILNGGQTQGYEQLGLNPGDNQTHLKAAGEKLCSSTWDYDDDPNPQECYRRWTFTSNRPPRMKSKTKARGGGWHQQSPLTVPGK